MRRGELFDLNRLSLGLDIGIGSIGWALLDLNCKKMVDFGVHMFNEASAAQEPRLNRSARRTLTRRKWRKKQLRQAFVDFGLLSVDDFKIPGFLSFTENNDQVSRPKDETVYHLRLRALSEKVSMRELAMALYNICGTRGHFLMETVDFSKADAVTFDVFKERFYQVVSPFVDFDFDLAALENEVLKPVYNKEIIKKNDAKALFKKASYAKTSQEDAKLEEIVYLLIGRKANLANIDERVMFEDSSNSVDIIDLLKKDSLNDFLNAMVELHDLIEVSNILKDSKYICEHNVKQLKFVKEVYKMEKADPERYGQYKKEIQSVMSSVGKNKRRLRVIKNMQNKYPNGLYVKELAAILHKQQEFYPAITDEFIEVCVSICQARIPYYVGPLSPSAKNAWLIKDENKKFKYSYAYSMNKFGIVNEFETIKKWKEAMVSRCTYLPDEMALPKGSFLGETFSILNELNILLAQDHDGNDYYLSSEDKIKVFDELFLKQGKVNYKDVADLLGLSYFGPRNSQGTKKFNNEYTICLKVMDIVPELKVKSITDIFQNRDLCEKLEDALLNINLFDEEVSRKKFFMKEYGYSQDVAKKLSLLQCKGFYSFSKKFILDTVINTSNQSLLECMFEPNENGVMNEQMTLIHNATDIDGNPIHFDSNKYVERLAKNDNRLDVNLLIDHGKPFIPVSRPVIRALNECFKVYSDVVKMYGVPSRIVVETAKDLKDFSEVKTVPAKHYDEMKKCYEDLKKQIAELKKKRKNISFGLDSWDELEKYLLQNKRKIELYIRQNGRDMISGDPIDINNLNDYEIDHILPRGFGDNSMDNLMLIHRKYNSKKMNRLPLEYIEQEEVLNNSQKQVVSSDFLKRCKELYDLKMISENKLNQLSLKSTDDAMGFINRNLVDTRYIIREFMAVLRAYGQVMNYDTHVVALKASFTNVYRNAFDIKKNRENGDQHHAYDAATVVLADQVLSAYYPHYDERGDQKVYKDFLKKMTDVMKKDCSRSNMYELNRFISFAYKKAFGDFPNDYSSTVSYIKRTTPLYYMKAERKYTGQFFDATLYKPVNKKDGVLSILGVNNDKRSFSSINCVAVDFYKYTNNKGKKKHVAIHIPRVIVNAKGEINKEQYIKLIKDFYKEPELLDENGNIKEYYFRLRVYKNDLIYDSNAQEIQKFNVGSIVNRKLEMKHVYCFAYYDLSNRIEFYKKSLDEQFNLKNAKNKNGKAFADYKINEFVNYSIDNLMQEFDKSRYRKTVEKVLSGSKNYSEFLNNLAYIDAIVNRNCTPPTITGQYTPTASTPGEDAEYVKLKMSNLGIRWTHNEKGTLLISGPHGHGNAYSKIKRETFSWSLSSGVVE